MGTATRSYTFSHLFMKLYSFATRVISHHQQTILTYDALDRDSNALARGLQKLGVKKGDRVAVSLGNNVEFATVGRHQG